MKLRRSNHIDLGLNYRNQVFLALVCSLVLFHIVFRVLNWYPESDILDAREWEEVYLDEVSMTQQPDAVPPPPRPRITPPEISETVIEEEPDWDEFDLDTGLIDTDGIAAGNAGETAIVDNPDRPARVRRIVEAVTPQQARNLDYKVEVTVTLLVMPNGRVDEVFISSIVKIKEDGTRTEVNSMDYGIIEESMRAASGWLFVPAQHNGQPVASYSRHRFTF